MLYPRFTDSFSRLPAIFQDLCSLKVGALCRRDPVRYRTRELKNPYRTVGGRCNTPRKEVQNDSARPPMTVTRNVGLAWRGSRWEVGGV